MHGIRRSKHKGFTGARILRIVLPSNREERNQVKRKNQDDTPHFNCLPPNVIAAKYKPKASKRYKEQLQFHSALIADLESLGRDLASEAGLVAPPTTFEFMLAFRG